MLQAQKIPVGFTNCFIAMGSNLPSPAGGVRATISVALKLLKEASLDITRQSRLFSTPAFPPGSGPDFINAVLMIRTRLSAAALLDLLHQTEAKLGRTRKIRWGARVLDLDLLAYGDRVIPDLATYQRWRNLPVTMQAKTAPDQLILPHPRMHERGFVLVPMLDIAPDWRHPVLGQTVAELVRALDPSMLAGITPLQADLAEEPPD